MARLDGPLVPGVPQRGHGDHVLTPPRPGMGASSVLGTSVVCMYLGIPIPKLVALLRRRITHFFDK